MASSLQFDTPYVPITQEQAGRALIITPRDRNLGQTMHNHGVPHLATPMRNQRRDENEGRTVPLRMNNVGTRPRTRKQWRSGRSGTISPYAFLGSFSIGDTAQGRPWNDDMLSKSNLDHPAYRTLLPPSFVQNIWSVSQIMHDDPWCVQIHSTTDNHPSFNLFLASILAWDVFPIDYALPKLPGVAAATGFPLSFFGKNVLVPIAAALGIIVTRVLSKFVQDHRLDDLRASSPSCATQPPSEMSLHYYDRFGPGSPSTLLSISTSPEPTVHFRPPPHPDNPPFKMTSNRVQRLIVSLSPRGTNINFQFAQRRCNPESHPAAS
ncbi:hypothetical protein C8R44DRAFT_747604 [Mycena epipterygia]|nr:hypothetical protein C8R44DRAFT_747604 [Mycena epipterygia]